MAGLRESHPIPKCQEWQRGKLDRKKSIQVTACPYKTNETKATHLQEIVSDIFQILTYQESTAVLKYTG